jgi:PAS domain-containing protein
MEALATLLARMVGGMALVRYYSGKNSIYLVVGAGFLGTGFLDGYHAIVTSAFFRPFMPSEIPSLIPWSWVASRQFLWLIMFLSWIGWLIEERTGVNILKSERAIYYGTALFTILSFVFFAFVPLPTAYVQGIFFDRPEEFVPALIFAVALIGYLQKGRWQHNAFEYWVDLSLIIGLISQAVFMSHSGKLFDFEFDVAHSFKKLSYICVLIGLMISMYFSFKREQDSTAALSASEGRLRAVVDNIFDGVIVIDRRGTIQTVNSAAERIFQYAATDMIGQNSICSPPTASKASSFPRSATSCARR